MSLFLSDKKQKLCHFFAINQIKISSDGGKCHLLKRELFAIQNPRMTKREKLYQWILFYSVLQDELNKGLFKDKKYCREVATACVENTGKAEIVEEFIDFLAAASEETRYQIKLNLIWNLHILFMCNNYICTFS